MSQTLVQQVIKYSKQYDMLQEGDRVLVGLSGGADSVCLLYILHEIRKEIQFSIDAVHIHHGIRGEEADADALFSKRLCEQLSIPFFLIKENVPEYAKENKVSLEEAGRMLRYATWERLKRERGYTKIALAHHANDSAETMLFHLFRGGRLLGLMGIPPVREDIIRPLLCCSRKEIEEWLAEQKIAYCIDSTNASDEYTRNKIRHHMITYAEQQINSKAVLHMQQTAEYLRQVKQFLDSTEKEIYDRAVQKQGERIRLSIPILQEAPSFLQTNLIYTIVSECGGGKDMSELHINQVLDLVKKQSGRGIDLPSGVRVTRSYDTLLFAKKSFDDFVQTDEMSCAGLEKNPSEMLQQQWYQKVQKGDLPAEYSYGEKGECLAFRVFPYKKTEEIPKNRYTKWFDYDKIDSDIFLRKRRNGDMIRLKSGTKKIKALFIDEKIPKEARDQIILVACETEILWIPGIRSSEAYFVDETTTRILEIKWSGERSR